MSIYFNFSIWKFSFSVSVNSSIKTKKDEETMETKSMRVVQQSEAFAVQSQKAENGQTMKCNIMLQEMGGKYENQYVAAILGNLATNKFTPGDIVAATMRFSTREYNGAHYQDILVTDIKCLTPAPSPKGGGE